MVNDLNEMIQSILESNQDLLSIAVKQRAKFENWLKIKIPQSNHCKY